MATAPALPFLVADTSYPPHRQRYEHLNHARFLTCSCYKRQPFLNAERSRLWFVDALDKAREKHKFDLWAWVIMPEHFHVLLYPDPSGSSVSAILSTIKQSVAKRSLLWVRERAPEFLERMADPRHDGTIVHRFWQRGGGYDRNFWSPKHIWSTIDYIHENPVTRGLCERQEDWKWSSAVDHVGCGEGLLPIDPDRIPARPA